MNNRSGFSLVEVLFAVMILGVGIAGLTHGMATALRSDKDAEQRSVAAMIAQGQLELLRADGIYKEGSTEGECGEGLENYSWSRTIRQTGNEGLMEVVVSVMQKSGNQTLFELRTMLYQPPATTEESKDPKNRTKEKNRRGGGRGQ